MNLEALGTHLNPGMWKHVTEVKAFDLHLSPVTISVRQCLSGNSYLERVMVIKVWVKPRKDGNNAK